MELKSIERGVGTEENLEFWKALTSISDYCRCRNLHIYSPSLRGHTNISIFYVVVENYKCPKPIDLLEIQCFSIIDAIQFERWENKKYSIYTRFYLDLNHQFSME